MPSKAYVKLKKEIKKMPDFNRGFYSGFWAGYIHCLHDYDYITEEEGMELEDMFKVKG